MFLVLKKKIKQLKEKKYIELLTKTNSIKIENYGEKLLIKQIKILNKTVPLYKNLYQNIDINNINKIQDFKNKIPIIEKKDVFTKKEISFLVKEGNLNEMALLMSSSGFSQNFSYGIISKKNNNELIFNIDLLLKYIYKIKENEEIFIINALPMGVKINTTFKLTNCSVREDMVIASYEIMKKEVSKIIIIADPNFLKKIIEFGINKNGKWEKETYFISGEDFLPETLRDYLLEILKDNNINDIPKIGQTMGITELDLNIFHETEKLIQIRKVLHQNKELREKLFGKEFNITPTIFHYYPHKTYIEVTNKNKEGIGELVFSMLSSSLAIQLIRYNSKDIGKIISYEELSKFLDENNLKDLKPDFHLPICAVYGRYCEKKIINGKKISLEEIREKIYIDKKIAKKITGLFKLKTIKNRTKIYLQYTKNNKANKTDQRKLEKILKNELKIDVEVIILNYYELKEELEINYEKKFNLN